MRPAPPMLALLLALLPIRAARAAPPDQTSVLVVVGAAGTEEFGAVFAREADRWQRICARAGAACALIGTTPPGPGGDRERLRAALQAEPKEGPGMFWLVLIGHGTFDGEEARFNLRGPDVTAEDLALWLRPFHRRLALIDTSSASAPFLNRISGPDRVVITATRSGEEQNYARFGSYFAAALDDPRSDLDHDGQVSLLEAFLSASARVAEFYRTEGRLATEHALIDDNGDGLGTPADWFAGIRAVKRARDGAAADGALARQFVLLPSAEERALSPEARARRDRLELAAARLRERKESMPEADYYRQLEALMLQLARLYAGSPAPSAP